jgi:hypothetical protein
MLRRVPPTFVTVLALSVPVAAGDLRPPDPFNPFNVKIGSLIASDYVDRGTTQSAHRPSASSSLEIQGGDVYVRAEVNSVKLPTDPPAEINAGFGVRHTFGSMRIDLNSEYSHYPREAQNGRPADTDFWEHSANWYYDVSPEFEINGQFAWAPNFSKTGAWSKYSELGFAAELPKRLFPSWLGAEFSSGIGRFWFGNVAPEMGGYRLPAHTYWHAGIEFVAAPFKLDLRYHDTNLSKEDCFVFAGDPDAIPGGLINEVSNPKGLRSHWCSGTFVATLSMEFNSATAGAGFAPRSGQQP